MLRLSGTRPTAATTQRKDLMSKAAHRWRPIRGLASRNHLGPRCRIRNFPEGARI